MGVLERLAAPGEVGIVVVRVGAGVRVIATIVVVMAEVGSVPIPAAVAAVVVAADADAAAVEATAVAAAVEAAEAAAAVAAAEAAAVTATSVATALRVDRTGCHQHRRPGKGQHCTKCDCSS